MLLRMVYTLGLSVSFLFLPQACGDSQRNLRVKRTLDRSNSVGAMPKESIGEGDLEGDLPNPNNAEDSVGKEAPAGKKPEDSVSAELPASQLNWDGEIDLGSKLFRIVPLD